MSYICVQIMRKFLLLFKFSPTYFYNADVDIAEFAY